MTEPKTHTLDLLGARLTYDVTEAESESTQPLLLMIGSPMEASGFTTLAGPCLVASARRGGRWLAVVLSIGDLIMARRQLLNLKQHAERHQHQSNPSDHSD